MLSAEPRISERVMLKRDRFFVVSDRTGSINPLEFAGDGLWDEDTRLLSGLRVLINGTEPAALGVQLDDAAATFESEAAGLHVTRTRFIDSGLHERITITNRGATLVEALFEVVVAADFAAMLGIRGGVRELMHPEPVPPVPTADGVRFERARAATRVIASPDGLSHALRLMPGDDFTLRVEVVPEPGGPVIDFVAGLQETRDSYARWADDCVSIRTDNPAVNELLGQALADVRMLCSQYDTGLYPTAGLPWYAVPFGRDALITAILLLPVNPDVARSVLRFLAHHQGRREDARTDEEPGKILHEVRSGEVVDRGLWPHILYGTIDASALFLCALNETEIWTGDHKFADELWPHAEAALEWCTKYGDMDGDGYIEYPGGPQRNIGWKDSGDSLTNTDGSAVARPAALCEVQAYLYRGLMGMSRREPALRQRAAALKRRFNRDFWMPKARFIAQGLDGSKQQVQAVTSNPGHCLWMRIVHPSKAASVASRLVSPDLFSGWGIRTLAAGAVNYDPCSYHNGSVWPFDTAFAVAGMRRYGFAAEAEVVARALIEASLDFPMHRPPELFCGDVREPGKAPKEYWNTCTPQLWSAAAMFSCVASILGLSADTRRRTLEVAPIETSLWNRVEVKGLHFAGGRVDFTVEGTVVKFA